MNPFQPLTHLITLTWWRWARSSLTRKDPCHPDLPSIITRVRELEAPVYAHE